jgi:hypothetical protein
MNASSRLVGRAVMRVEYELTILWSESKRKEYADPIDLACR